MIMSQDEKHLNLLSIFQFIFAGLKILFSCFFLMYVVIGIAMLCGAIDGKDAPPRFVGIFFVLFGSLFILAGWIIAVLMIVFVTHILFCRRGD
jgi:hypothetical protein